MAAKRREFHFYYDDYTAVGIKNADTLDIVARVTADDVIALTTRVASLEAALREMLANHGRDFRWDTDGKFKGEYDCGCPGCVAGRAVLESAAKEGQE